MAVLTKIGRGEDFHTEMFGENVYVFSPVDDAAQVQGILDRLWSAQEKNQFGWERCCVYFLPGEYDKDISVMPGGLEAMTTIMQPVISGGVWRI